MWRGDAPIGQLSLLKISTGLREAGDFREPAVPSRSMVAILLPVLSILVFRFRSRAALELKVVALQHQLAVLRRQRPGRPQLSPLDRLLWVLLYRIWPQVIDAMILVKPATVIAWHRKGFRFYWRCRSRRPGRPRINAEIRDLIRVMSNANPLWGRRAFTGSCSSSASRSARPQSGGGCRGGPRSLPRPGGAFCAITFQTLRRLTCSWSPPRLSSCSTP